MTVRGAGWCGASRIAHALPLALRTVMALALGVISWWLMASRRRQAERVYARLGWPGCSGQRLAHFSFRSFALMSSDVLAHARGQRLALTVCDPFQVIPQWSGRALVAATIHANWEMLGVALEQCGLIRRALTVAASNGDAVMDAWFAQLRSGHQCATVMRGQASETAAVIAAHRHLRSGGALILAADRDYGSRAFGPSDHPVRVPLGPGRLALRAGVPVIAVALFRRPSAQWLLIIGRPRWGTSSTAADDDATAALRGDLLRMIRAAPGQWNPFLPLH